MIEIWKQVPSWEGIYEVSSLGRIRSVSRRARIGLGNTRPIKPRVMKLSPSRGYLRFNASRGSGNYTTLKVHVCVARAFLPSPPGNVGRGSSDYCLDHKNGNKLDNRSDNLEWVTGLESRQRASRLGLVAHGENHHNSKLTVGMVKEIRRLVTQGVPRIKVAEIFSVSRSRISVIVSKRQWRHVA